LDFLNEEDFLNLNITEFGHSFLLLSGPGINDPYNLILEHTLWTIRRDDNINLWNDIWSSEKCISMLIGVPYAKRIKLKAIVAQGWKESGSWNLFPSFLNI